LALREEGRSYSLPGFPKKEKSINKAKNKITVVGPHPLLFLKMFHVPSLVLSRIKVLWIRIRKGRHHFARNGSVSISTKCKDKHYRSYFEEGSG
jgi:hypothetical protein